VGGDIRWYEQGRFPDHDSLSVEMKPLHFLPLLGLLVPFDAYSEAEPEEEPKKFNLGLGYYSVQLYFRNPAEYGDELGKAYSEIVQAGVLSVMVSARL
jgi:hypothetical protein